MASTQTLSDSDRRTIARWALSCAERVLPLFDADETAVRGVRDHMGAHALGAAAYATKAVALANPHRPEAVWEGPSGALSPGTIAP